MNCIVLLQMNTTNTCLVCPRCPTQDRPVRCHRHHHLIRHDRILLHVAHSARCFDRNRHRRLCSQLPLRFIGRKCTHLKRSCLAHQTCATRTRWIRLYWPNGEMKETCGSWSLVTYRRVACRKNASSMRGNIRLCDSSTSRTWEPNVRLRPGLWSNERHGLYIFIATNSI